MGNHSQSVVNLICSMSVLLVNLFISFWLSPFVIRTIGVEANGFISLAGNFITYASIIEMAMSSMASRFITIEYIKGNYQKANIYYNSVFWGRLMIILVLIGPAVYLVGRLEHFVNVPQNILTDVRLLFGIMFGNFFFSLCLPNWGVATFATNKLHRYYIPDAVLNLLRAVLLFGVLTLLIPKVYYIAAVSLVLSIVSVTIQWYNKKLLLPNLSLSLRRGKRIYSRHAIWELISSGVWNSISSVGNMLLSGMDLLVCNLFLGPTAMGIVALSKILPAQMQTLSASVRSAFTPSITINYAKGDMEVVYRDLRRAMKMTSFIMIIPIAGIVTFGDWFFSLWVPSQNAQLLQTLSVLGIVGYMFTSGTQILFSVFGVVNKVRPNSIAMVSSGVVSICTMYLLVKYTDLGIYIFAGVSMIVNLVRNMTFTLPVTARYLGFKWTRFYPQVGQTVLASIVLIIIGQILKPWLPSGSWISLILSVIAFCVVAIPVSLVILFNRGERKYLLEKAAHKLKIKRVCTANN